jgi:hypothetical protein
MLKRSIKHRPAKGFKVNKKKKWKFYDGYTTKGNHLVLYGKDRKPLVVLKHSVDPNGDITIHFIQRHSKPYSLFANFHPDHLVRRMEHSENQSKEKERHTKAKEELNEHTSEFLLKEFIYLHREALLNGKQIKLMVPAHNPERKNYLG